MSTDFNSPPMSPNPYGAPPPYGAPGAAKRPGWLTAMCVISIVLGSLGIIGGLSGVVGLAMQSRTQQINSMFMPPGPAGGPQAKMKELQEEMQQAIQPVIKRWNPFSYVLILFRLVQGGMLVAGGIMTIGLKPTGRSLLTAVLLVSIPIDLAQAALQAVIQHQTMAVVGSFMPRMMEASAPPGKPLPAGVSNMTTTMMNVAAIGMIVFTVVWVGVKIGFYISSALYLRRPAIVSLFPGAAPGVAPPGPSPAT